MLSCGDKWAGYWVQEEAHNARPLTPLRDDELGKEHFTHSPECAF